MKNEEGHDEKDPNDPLQIQDDEVNTAEVQTTVEELANALGEYAVHCPARHIGEGNNV